MLTLSSFALKDEMHDASTYNTDTNKRGSKLSSIDLLAVSL